MESCTFCGSRDPCVVPIGALSEAYSASCVASLLTVLHIEVSDPVATRLASSCADCLQLTRDIDLELRSLLKFLKNLDLLRSRLARRVKRAATNSEFSVTRDLNEKIQQEIPLVNKAFETFSNLLRIEKRENNKIKNVEKICKQEILAIPEIKEEPFYDQDEINVDNEVIEGGDIDDDMDTFAIDPVVKSCQEYDDSDSSDYSPSFPDSEDSPSEDDDDESTPNPPPNNDEGDATSSNPFKCSVCFKTFAQVTTKNRHFRHHHDPTYTPYECPVDNCDRVFRQSWHFRDHIEKFHPGVAVPLTKERRRNVKINESAKKRIPCPVEACEKSYARNYRVVEHMKLAHPEVPLPRIKERRPPQKIADGDQPRIPCPVESCEKSYSRNYRLVEHMKFAHPEVPLPIRKKRPKREGPDPEKIADGEQHSALPKERIIRMMDYQVIIIYVFIIMYGYDNLAI